MFCGSFVPPIFMYRVSQETRQKHFMYRMSHETRQKQDDLKVVFIFCFKFATFICQPYFSSKILELRIPKYPYFWHFQNVVCLFCAFNTTRNIDSTKRADHILKIPGLGEFHGYYWSHESVQVKVGWRLKVTNKFKAQRRLSCRLSTTCFVGLSYSQCKTTPLGENK